MALFGAILVDASFSIPIMRGIYATQFAPFFAQHSIGPNEQNQHAKSRLFELMSARSCVNWSIERTTEEKGKCDAKGESMG